MVCDNEEEDHLTIGDPHGLPFMSVCVVWVMQPGSKRQQFKIYKNVKIVQSNSWIPCLVYSLVYVVTLDSNAILTNCYFHCVNVHATAGGLRLRFSSTL